MLKPYYIKKGKTVIKCGHTTNKKPKFHQYK